MFGGVGITAGMSLNAYTYISYETDHSTESSGTSSSNTSYGNTDFETEKFRNKNNTGFSAFIPMGVDFRIGRNKEFWKRLHLYYEFSPSINVVNVPELRTFTTANIKHGLGLKVSLD